MAEGDVDFERFKDIHAATTMPKAKLSWGKWERVGILRAKMDMQKGEVDGATPRSFREPGHAVRGCVIQC